MHDSRPEFPIPPVRRVVAFSLLALFLAAGVRAQTPRPSTPLPTRPNTAQPSPPPRPASPSRDDQARERKRRMDEERKKSGQRNVNGNGALGPAGGVAGAPSATVVKAALKSFESWKNAQGLQKDGASTGKWVGLDKNGKKAEVEFDLTWRHEGAEWQVLFVHRRAGDVPPAAYVGTGPTPWSLTWHSYTPEDKKLVGPSTELPAVFSTNEIQLADLLPIDSAVYDRVVVEEEGETNKIPTYSYRVTSSKAVRGSDVLRIILRRDGRDAVKIEKLDADDYAVRSLAFSDFVTSGVHRVATTRAVVNEETLRARSIKLKVLRVNGAIEASLFDPKNLAAIVAPKPAKDAKAPEKK